MSNNEAMTVIFSLVAGVGMIATTFIVKKGYQKWWFLSEASPVVPKDIVYGLLPLGIGFVLAGWGLTIYSRPLTMVGLFGGGALTFIFMARKPDWVKPDWLLWLETNYNRQTVEFMLNQARQNRCDRSWSMRMDVEEDRKTWAEEMAEKYEQLKRDPNTIW